MDANGTAGRHLTLVGGANGLSSGRGRAPRGQRRLRAVVLQEYLDKLPEFLPVAEVLQMCGMRYPELADAADRGRVVLERRDGGMGIVVADNLAFLREQRLLQLPVPRRLRVTTSRHGDELIGVSRAAYAELARRADEYGTNIADVVDGLLAR